MAVNLENHESLRDNMLSELESALRSNSRVGRRSSSKELAKLVLQHLTVIIKNKEWNNAQDLLRILREFGNKLVSFPPTNHILL